MAVVCAVTEPHAVGVRARISGAGRRVFGYGNIECFSPQIPRLRRLNGHGHYIIAR